MNIEEFKRIILSRAFISASEKTAIISRTGGESSWLFDFRSVMLDARWLDAYAELFWERHAQRYPFQVGGMESASIPLVTAIVLKGKERGTPVNGFYIRKSRKKDGLLKAVEGTLNEHPVVLVDDILNSGATMNKQVLVLADLGISVSCIAAIVRFRKESEYRFAAARGIAQDALFTLEDFGLPLIAQSRPAGEHVRLRWRFKAPGASFEHVVPKSAPACDGERVYTGSDSGIMYALRADSGEVEWQFRTGAHPKGKGIFSSPALHGNTVYFGAYDGNVYALDARSGREMWRYAEADWIGSSPAVAPDLDMLFIGLEFGLLKKHGGVAALSLADGAEQWRIPMREFTHSSPLYVRQRQAVAVGNNDGSAYCIDARTGSVRWRVQTGGPIKASFAYDQGADAVIFGSFDGHAYAVGMDGLVRWRFKTEAPIYSTPLVHDTRVYIASLDKNLYALSAEGRELWRFQTAGRIFSSPVVGMGSLYLGSNDGTLNEVDPDSGAEKSRYQISERIVNAVCVDERAQRIYLPSHANEIYCLERIAP